MGGNPNNVEADHPMSVQNQIGPEYEDIDDIKRGSGSEPSKESINRTTGDLSIIPKPTESSDEPPSVPVKRKVSQLSNPRPPVPATRRPSGAIETLAMGIFKLGDPQHPRKAPVDGARVNACQQWQDRRDSQPPLLPRARRPSELGDPSTPLPEANMPQATSPPAISEQRERIYSNVQSSEIGDPSTPLPETNMPQTTIPPAISEQSERLYGNVQPTVAKIPVESHYEEAVNGNDDHDVYLEFGHTGEAPLETQQT